MVYPPGPFFCAAIASLAPFSLSSIGGSGVTSSFTAPLAASPVATSSGFFASLSYLDTSYPRKRAAAIAANTADLGKWSATNAATFRTSVITGIQSGTIEEI